VDIVTIDEKSPQFEEVVELGRANAATLGFLPRGAFRQYAKNSQLLVALDDERRVLGYLLYGTTRRKMQAYIVHLCVAQSQRGKGIADCGDTF